VSQKTAILMRTKDRPVFLRRALESVLAQTDQDWEIVLINDGGNKEQLAAAVASFAERLRNRLRVVHLETSLGRGKGRHLNLGLQNSESGFVAIHDDDDSWDPGFLSGAKAAMGEHSAVVTQSWLVTEKIEQGTIREISRELYEPWQLHGISLFRLAESLTFPPIALLFRRSVIQKIGAFDDELGPLEDWEFCLRLFAEYECPFLEEPLAYYHQRAEGQGSDANSRANAKKIYARLDARIRNRLLREDLAKGRAGLGFLVNMALSHGHVFSELRGKK
jgi:glycosyltransferase involved in cell wall biosynthesis